jgi:hypothetical protein
VESGFGSAAFTFRQRGTRVSRRSIACCGAALLAAAQHLLSAAQHCLLRRSKAQRGDAGLHGV